MFFHLCDIKPYTGVIKLEDAYEYYHYKWYQSFYRTLFKVWLYPELMTTEAQELIVNPANKGFADLHIKPISFGHKAHEYVNEIYWLYNSYDRTKRDTQNS